MTYEQNISQYHEKKERLVQDFQARLKHKGAISLGKSTSNIFRHRESKKSKLNVRDFNNVLQVDSKAGTIEVEGMTTYEECTRVALKHDMMPTVVPQLKSITVGGAVTGLGIEASSFKFGLVHETVTEMEIMLADGQVIMCTPTNKYRDLFFAFPNSYGTLGYALKIKVKAVPVKKYVKITHKKYSDTEKYFHDLAEFCQKKNDFDFIDGTIFNENEMFITIGHFADHAPYTSNYQHMYIYYQSIRKKETDYLTTSDFIWRWDTDWFWCSKHFGAQNRLVRLIAGKKFLRSTTYWKLRSWDAKFRFSERLRKRRTGERKESIVQDVEIPIDHATTFMDFFHSEIGIKPVWVCPTQMINSNVRYDLYEMNPRTLYINFGFWDAVSTTHGDGFYNRKIEKKVQELKGRKSLYSTSYYSREEFGEIYNAPRYQELKQKYDPNRALGDLYEKCVKRK